MADATSKGWPSIGKPGSTAGQRYYKEHVVRVDAGGITVYVAREVAPLVHGFIQEIVDRGYKLDDRRDDWGYNHRYIAGTTTLSNHSWGLAIDLNATQNPMTFDGRVHTNMPAWVIEAADRWGFYWGGNYHGTKKDPMHFEFLGSPSDAAKHVAAIAQLSSQFAARKVSPMFEPPVPVVDALECPLGGCWLLAENGAVYTTGKAPWLGGMNDPKNKADFVGRAAARLHPFGHGYQIEATSGEKYVPKV